MGLFLNRPDQESLPEHGYGVVGEVLGKPETEWLMDVWPLEDIGEARRVANFLQEKGQDGRSWLAIPVSFVEVIHYEDDVVEAQYVEASNLTHPGHREAA